METLSASAAIMSSSSHFLILSTKKNSFIRPIRYRIASKNDRADLDTDSNDTNIFHHLKRSVISPLSKDAAMGLVLSAAADTGPTGSGWTTGSEIEIDLLPLESMPNPSQREFRPFHDPFCTKSPDRRMRVAFTCNTCRRQSTLMAPSSFSGLHLIPIISFWSHFVSLSLLLLYRYLHYTEVETMYAMISVLILCMVTIRNPYF